MLKTGSDLILYQSHALELESFLGEAAFVVEEELQEEVEHVAVEVELLEPYAPAAAAVEHQEHFSLVPCYSRFAVAVVVVGPAQIAAVEVELV